MDYADDNCMHAFSNGQKAVMRAVLGGSASGLGLGSRAQLVNNAITTCNLNPVATCIDPVLNNFSMGFETTESLTGWVTENTNNDTQPNTSDAVTWGIASGQQTDGDYGAYSGNQYARYFYNQNSTTGANDWLFSPCLSLKTGRNYTLSFYTAVGSSSGTIYAEKMSCYLTNAQNSTPSSLVRVLRNLGTLTNAYPNYQQTLVNFTVTSNGDYYLGFYCNSDADKYVLLLDNINLSGTITSTENIDISDNIKVYPNPVSDILTIDIPNGTLLKNSSIMVTDMLGRSIYNSILPVGEYRHFINTTNEWSAGVYMLTVNIDGTLINKRFVIQHP